MSRSRSDRLYPPATIGPREHEAVELVQARPGLTVGEMAAALGVSLSRADQIVTRLESLGRLQRQAADRPPPRFER